MDRKRYFAMVPIPRPSFLDRQERLGFKHGAPRWRSEDGKRLYEWDHRHGHIEVYTRRGVHLGTLDPITGIRIGDPVKGRRVDV